MTSYIDTVSNVGKEIMPLDVTTFADSAERFIAGIEVSQEITIAGPYDDTATTGQDAVMGTLVGATQTFEVNPVGTAAGARKISMEMLWTGYKVIGAVKERMQYELTGKQDGSATITTN